MQRDVSSHDSPAGRLYRLRLGIQTVLNGLVVYIFFFFYFGPFYPGLRGRPVR